jgi:hypothetical protein
MEEKDRKAYEELMRQQDIKQDKEPFKERLKEDWNIFLVIIFGGAVAYANYVHPFMEIFGITNLE